MRFEFNRYSSVLLIFFVHALVYAVLLFRKGIVNGSRSDKWLAVFLLLCVLYICPWMVGFAGWYDNQPYRDMLFYIPFQQLFFIGPVIFFYVQALLNPSFRFQRKHWFHLLPGIIYLLFCVVMVVTDKLVLHKYYFLADQSDRDFDAWYQLAGLASMLAYLIASVRYYGLYRRLLVQVISNADHFQFRWIRNFLFAFLTILIIRSVFFIFALFVDFDYWSTWWYYLTFALVSYYIAITGYANSIEARVAFTPNLVTYKSMLLLVDARSSRVRERSAARDAAVLVDGSPRSVDSGRPGTERASASLDSPRIAVNPPDAVVIDRANPSVEVGGHGELIDLDVLHRSGQSPLPTELAGLRDGIDRLLKEQRLYEDPELSLATVARELGTNVSLVSRAVNQGFGMNFNDLVNKHRIEAVIGLFGRGEHQRQTLLGIAFEAGFNSKATFNRSFKRVTGQTPKEFLRAL